MLWAVFFGNNEIVELHPNLFSECKKLETIVFDNNKLKGSKLNLEICKSE